MLDLSQKNGIEPPHGLYETIIHRIRCAEQKAARVKLVCFALISCALSIGVFFVFTSTARQIYISGFATYLLLFLSDGNVVLASWKEFTLLLAESLPTLEIAFVIAGLLALFASLRYTAKQFIVARQTTTI